MYLLTYLLATQTDDSLATVTFDLLATKANFLYLVGATLSSLKTPK